MVATGAMVGDRGLTEPDLMSVTSGGSAPRATGGGGGLVGRIGNKVATQVNNRGENGLAALQAADPTRGYSTPYYAAYTNDGDLAGAVMVGEGQRVRLIDPTTGQVFVERTGPQGAQEIVSLANAVSQDLGRKAAWQIQGETAPDQFTTMAGERYDPKKTGLLGTIVRIAAPVLGAMIPGLAPVLGAALGGFGGTMATGGNLKESLLAGATGALGNVAGGSLSSVLKGGSLGSGAATALRANPGSIGGALGSALGGGGAGATSSALSALGALPGEIAPLFITAPTQGITGALGGVAGALGNAISSGANATRGAVTALNQPDTFAGGEGQDVLGGANYANDPLTSGLAGAGGAVGETLLDPITVTAAQGQGLTPPLTGLQDVPGLQSTEYSPLNNSAFANQQTGQTVQDGGMLDPRSLLGEVLGGVGADMGVYTLADLLGLGPGGGDLSGVPDAGYEQAPAPAPQQPVIGGGTAGGTPGSAGDGTVGAGVIGGGGAGGAAPGGAGGGGGAGGALIGGGADAAPSAAGVGQELDLEGSFAPDIYPWRKAAA